jgi:hypothetical protein
MGRMCLCILCFLLHHCKIFYLLLLSIFGKSDWKTFEYALLDPDEHCTPTWILGNPGHWVCLINVHPVATSVWTKFGKSMLRTCGLLTRRNTFRLILVRTWRKNQKHCVSKDTWITRITTPTLSFFEWHCNACRVQLVLNIEHAYGRIANKTKVVKRELKKI